MGKDSRVIFDWRKKTTSEMGDTGEAKSTIGYIHGEVPDCLPEKWKDKIESNESPLNEDMIGYGAIECHCGRHIIHWFNAPSIWPEEHRITVELKEGLVKGSLQPRRALAHVTR